MTGRRYVPPEEAAKALRAEAKDRLCTIVTRMEVKDARFCLATANAVAREGRRFLRGLADAIDPPAS